MKKILILTLYGNNNFGNKLQNYALQEYLKKINCNITIHTQKIKYNTMSESILKKIIWNIIHMFKILVSRFNLREKKFREFNKKYINYTTKTVSIFSNSSIDGYDAYIYGSDQIWNPNGVGKFNLFLGERTKNNISYAASFSSDFIPDSLKFKYKENLSKFLYISVREESGKEIVDELTGRKDCVVLIDPTMLLTASEWNKISNKPKQISTLCSNGEKYILNYFLGELKEDRKKEINRIARENNCKIINILDKKDPFYLCGPSEFLWLEKNAFLICTDSFHSSVFAILFKRPFIVFNRDDGQIGKNSMNSRIETLLKNFKLENRYYNGKITEKILNCDYSHVDEILKKEIKKSNEFLKIALDIK